ncbi:MAG: class I SAM-dependent methyltransferase [Terracidiphilus sp.]
MAQWSLCPTTATFAKMISGFTGLQNQAFESEADSMRILLVVASYGSQNDFYLERVLAEYRSMPHQVNIVVLSNIRKNLGAGIEVRVGLPTSNPFSLPFGHKQIFAERLNDYDLFIYSEDDMLIKAENIAAFLEQSAVLPVNQVPGFLRIERGPDGTIKYCDIHAGFYWDPRSVRSIGGHTFAYFSNEHAACFILTRQQLKNAIDSGGFLVKPHEGKYEMRESAATDPYVQCGLRKMICISHLDRSCVHHLPNKYFDRFGLVESDLRAQVDALLRIERNGSSYAPLIQMEGRLKGSRYLKDHYEPARTEILPLVPENARSVLSFGCGETEIALAQRGMRVLAVPVDPVVSAAAAGKGIELVIGDLDSVVDQLKGQTVDCLLFINVLHLVKDPIRLISAFRQFLKEDGVAIALVPQISGIQFFWGWLRKKEGRKSYREAGVNITSPRLVRRWLKSAGLIPGSPSHIHQTGQRMLGVPRPSFISRIVAKEFIIRAMKKAGSHPG